MDRGQGSSDHRQRSGKHSSSESTRHEHSDQFPKSKRIRRDDEGERGGTKPHDAQRHRDRSGGLSRGSHREDKGQSREDKGQSREGHREAKVVKRSEHQKVVTNEPSHLRVGGKKEVEPPEEEAWLCRDLVVKVTDRQYKKGRHYNTKVSKQVRGPDEESYGGGRGGLLTEVRGTVPQRLKFNLRSNLVQWIA